MYHPRCFQLDIAGFEWGEVDRFQDPVILYIRKFVLYYHLIDCIAIHTDRYFVCGDYTFIIFALVGKIME